MTITIDGIYVVGGIISRGEASDVTCTKDTGFVEMNEDYLDNIRKDYYGFSEEEFQRFK